MKVVFAGTPEFAVPVLEKLINSSIDVIAVYTQPDRPAGRGKKLQASPVKVFALLHNIPIYQPEKLTDVVACDAMVVVGYGLLLPERVLQAPRYGCINVHPSLLPKWRGATPVQQAIAAGDATTGVSVMKLDKGMDSGPIYAQEEYVMTGSETSGELYHYLFERGAELLVDVLLRIDHLEAQAQDHDKATYTGKIKKEDARINWSESAEKIAQKIRAYNPWPVAFTELNQERIRIFSASIMSHVEASPGVILALNKQGLDVATSDGVLRISELQMPGKKVMRAKDFANAYKDKFVIGSLFL